MTRFSECEAFFVDIMYWCQRFLEPRFFERFGLSKNRLYRRINQDKLFYRVSYNYLCHWSSAKENSSDLWSIMAFISRRSSVNAPPPPIMITAAWTPLCVKRPYFNQASRITRCFPQEIMFYVNNKSFIEHENKRKIKELGQYPDIVTSRLINNALIYVQTVPYKMPTRTYCVNSNLLPWFHILLSLSTF